MRKSRVILIGALLAILAIFVFAFFGIGGSNSGPDAHLEEDNDKYHMKLRFAPKEVMERDEKEPPNGWPLGGVDVVYFWTRPQDEARLEEFETHFRQELDDPQSVGENMSGEFAQLQLYFARGLESFAPWFRKLIVVIPDSVDSRPFNSSDPRVRYVTHSDFAPEKSVPIFNWRALLISFVNWSKINLSRHFVVVDDLSFPISYISPFSLISAQGELRLPIYNDDVSTPLFDTEAAIYENSKDAVEGALVKLEAQLGLSNLREVFNGTIKVPTFEARGWTLLDRQVLADLNAVCSETLEANRLHRMRRKDSVDLIVMHHIFIFWMRHFAQQPKSVSDYVSKFDLDKDGFLSHSEADKLTESLRLDTRQASSFLQNIFASQSLLESERVDINKLSGSSDVFQLLIANAARPQFRHVLVPSATVAIELRRNADLKLQKTIDILRSGGPTCLWAGPRILGPYGEYTREAMENFLYRILKTRHSSLESLYRPHPKLGLWIGLTFFLVFSLGSWMVTKCLLQKPHKSND